jgi:hypothetical protein
MEDKLEYYIEHEVRIRILEKISRQINNTLRWIFTAAVSAIIIPIVLKHYGY